MPAFGQTLSDEEIWAVRRHQEPLARGGPARQAEITAGEPLA